MKKLLIFLLFFNFFSIFSQSSFSLGVVTPSDLEGKGLIIEYGTTRELESILDGLNIDGSLQAIFNDVSSFPHGQTYITHRVNLFGGVGYQFEDRRYYYSYENPNKLKINVTTGPYIEHECCEVNQDYYRITNLKWGVGAGVYYQWYDAQISLNYMSPDLVSLKLGWKFNEY